VNQLTGPTMLWLGALLDAVADYECLQMQGGLSLCKSQDLGNYMSGAGGHTSTHPHANVSISAYLGLSDKRR
jgi:hypothetical protein